MCKPCRTAYCSQAQQIPGDELVKSTEETLKRLHGYQTFVACSVQIAKVTMTIALTELL